MIKIKSLSKSFGEKKVLENLNLEVKDREILSLLGPNGCGKTTLLNILSGLTRQDEGNIYIDDVLVSGKEGTKKIYLKPSDRKVGYVFQTVSLFPHMRVKDNVAYGLKALHLPSVKLRKEQRACWILWGYENTQSIIQANSAAVKNSALPWLGRWRRNRRCCF